MDDGKSCRVAATKYHISKSTASAIYQRKHEYIIDYENNANESRCRKIKKQKI